MDSVRPLIPSDVEGRLVAQAQAAQDEVMFLVEGRGYPGKREPLYPSPLADSTGDALHRELGGDDVHFLRRHQKLSALLQFFGLDSELAERFRLFTAALRRQFLVAAHDVPPRSRLKVTPLCDEHVSIFFGTPH